MCQKYFNDIDEIANATFFLDHFVERYIERLNSFSIDGMHYLRFLCNYDCSSHHILDIVDLLDDTVVDPSHFPVVFLCLRRGFTVDVMMHEQFLEQIILLFAEIGYRLLHLNYNRTKLS